MTLSAEQVGKGWKTEIGKAFDSDAMRRLRLFLDAEKRSGVEVFPACSDIFRALQMVDLDDVRVVILGQDPYHGDGQANGLAFAVRSGIAIPPSLRNIFKEIASDFECPAPTGTTLEGWARQGVLLLNTVLTVRAHEAFSHRGKGWEELTDDIIRSLNAREKPIVFMLWGTPSQKKELLIANKHHLVLKAAHPSPLSAYRGFFGCRHFSKANAFLRSSGLEIDWLKTDLV
ncbi:uracil-DNA glycosylase [bacterium]|nr:uracil-DNA glycosylase [bacterium]